jgi:hypothetical protein
VQHALAVNTTLMKLTLENSSLGADGLVGAIRRSWDRRRRSRVLTVGTKQEAYCGHLLKLKTLISMHGEWAHRSSGWDALRERDVLGAGDCLDTVTC